MKTEKVFLRIETPFSIKNTKTRQMILSIASIAVAAPLLLVWLYTGTPENRGLAERMTIFFVLWAVLGALPVALMYFNSYALVMDGNLVCNNLGFLKKQYPRESLSKAVRKKNRIEIYAGTKMVASLPDNAAARCLVEKLRLPL